VDALEAYKRAADVAREARDRRPQERPGWRMGDREFAWVAIHAFLEAAMEDETRPVVRDALRTLAGPYDRLRDLRDSGGDNGGGGAG
jgi:hypothetical protein